ncbi:MAG: ABC transporter permease [Stellaceae bacterium]
MLLETSERLARAARSETAPRVRQFGAVNWRGLWTLYLREVRRFLKIATQTVAAPVITTLLYLAIFLLAFGSKRVPIVAGVPFEEFLAPGLIMMAMIQNAFANTTSSLMMAKLQGNISDMLMPPLSPSELVWGLSLGGVSRGLLVGLVVGIAMVLAVHVGVEDWGLVVFHAVAASLMLSLLGIIAALWAEKFDHIAAVTNFIVMPLSFLSGTFYSIDMLPAPFRVAAEFNPFFYMIDGFRSGFIGHADGSIPVGIAVMVGVNLALLAITHLLFARGYKLKT